MESRNNKLRKNFFIKHAEICHIGMQGCITHPFSNHELSILKTMNRSRNTTATVHKTLAGESVYRHHRSIAQQTSKLHRVTHLLAHHRNNAHSSCLLVDHANGTLICNNARNRCGRCIAGNGNHVQTYRTYTGHRFKFFDGECTSLYSINHTLIFRHWNESTRQATHIRGSHHTTLLHLIIQQSQSGSSAWSTRMFHTNTFENISHRVTNRWCWSQTQVDDAKWHTQSARSLLSHQLTHTSNLEGCALDGLTEYLKIS